MYEAFYSSSIKTALLKSITGKIITDRSKQMEKWAEHYPDLHSTETVLTNTDLENTSLLLVTQVLDDSPEELRKAVDALASGKAHGKDGIPAKINLTRTSKRANRSVLSSISANSCYSPGRKGLCLKTCAMSV
ncbi:hypothetical protein ElyMa_006688300 [Elysia marginata]|uniref:Uncharacterized protein n=1 Tax=Elysia marginata TaxID=1093978 RepID=A0AAV4IN75_9GAST|nr:hypothetical protein ElyMa_006688300 [Elysia marginata]